MGERRPMMRFTTVGMVLAAVVLAGCGGGSDEASSVDATADPADYFEALEAWSIDIATRMEAVDRQEPTNDDPVEHADFRLLRQEAEVALAADLAQIVAAPETADAHSDLMAGFQSLVDFEERLADALRVAPSAGEVFDGAMSAELEKAGGGVLVPCSDLLDVARDLGIQVDLFCGSSNY